MDPEAEFVALVDGLLPQLRQELDTLEQTTTGLAAVPRDEIERRMLTVSGAIGQIGEKMMGLALGMIRLGLVEDPRLAEFRTASERLHRLNDRQSEILRAKGVYVPDFKPGKTLADFVTGPIIDPDAPLRTVARWIS
jgi:hypothetical protein